jgi:hypothetical protein
MELVEKCYRISAGMVLIIDVLSGVVVRRRQEGGVAG